MGFNLFLKLTKSYSTPETLARRATNDDIFGPSTEDLQELTKMTFKPKSCAKIVAVLEHRFEQSNRHWRQKSKALSVLQYFLIHGSPQATEWMQQHKKLLSSLLEVRYIDSNKNDKGKSVREKAMALLTVVKDPERIKETKKKYFEQRQGFRKSIGTGRPFSSSRNTLEMLRDSMFDDTGDINRAFQEYTTPQSPMAPTPTHLSDSEMGSSRNALCAIEEES